MQTLGSAECGVAKVKGSDVARNIFGGTAKGALRRFPLAEIRGGAKTACGGFLDQARAEPLAVYLREGSGQNAVIRQWNHLTGLSER
jgi:hypothetical protein